MEFKPFPPEFNGVWKLGFKMFSNFYINFYDRLYYKNWKLYCVALCALLHNLSNWAFMCKIFTEKSNAFEVAYKIPVSIVSVQAVIKAIIVLYRKSDIENLISELAAIWRTSNLTNEQMRTKMYLIKRLKLHLSLFYWSNMFSTWLHLSAPLVVVVFRRLFLSDDCKLTLIFSSVYPFDLSDNWIIYLSTYAFQAFTMLHIVYALLSSEFLMITFCGNLAIEFAILRLDLEHVMPYVRLDEMSDQSTFEQSKNINKYKSISIEEFIQRHQHLIRLAMKLDDVFNGMVLMNLFCVTVIICFFGFAITVARGFVETANNSIAVLAILLPLYIFCYHSELLKNESSEVDVSAYNSLWYNGDVQIQRTVVFIMARSQRASCLTSWGSAPITLNMFTKVLSTAWSYFSLLTSLYSSHDEIN